MNLLNAWVCPRMAPLIELWTRHWGPSSVTWAGICSISSILFSSKIQNFLTFLLDSHCDVDEIILGLWFYLHTRYFIPPVPPLVSPNSAWSPLPEHTFPCCPPLPHACLLPVSTLPALFLQPCLFSAFLWGTRKISGSTRISIIFCRLTPRQTEILLFDTKRRPVLCKNKTISFRDNVLEPHFNHKITAE